MTKRKLESIFIEHLDLHQDIVLKIARIYAPGPEDKDDLVQEILFQAWRSFKDFRKESRFSTWLYRVALNTALTATRFYRKKNLEIHNKNNPMDFHGSENQPDQSEEIDLLYAAIRKLKPIERGIILLYLEEKSYKEISEVMGITASNVSVRIVRIKNRLQEMLKSKL